MNTGVFYTVRTTHEEHVKNCIYMNYCAPKIVFWNSFFTQLIRAHSWNGNYI